MFIQLRPEQRVDKNGRLVTRHVRAGDTPAVGRTPLPAPTPPAPGLDTEKLIGAIEENLPGRRELVTVALSRGLISDTTLSALLDASADPWHRALLDTYVRDVLEHRAAPNSHLRVAAACLSFPMVRTLHEYGQAAVPKTSSDMRRITWTRPFGQREARSDEEFSALFKTRFFALRVGIEKASYGSDAKYLRDMELVRANIGRIEACLPSLAHGLQRAHLGGSLVGTKWEAVQEALEAVEGSGFDPTEMAEFMRGRGTTDFGEAISLMSQSSAPLWEGTL